MPFSWRRKPPTEDTIRRVAEEIYQNRLLLNRAGNTQSDWAKAEKITHSPLLTTLFATNRPLIKLGKHIFKPFNKHLKESAVCDIFDRLSPALEAIGVLLIPLVLYFATQAYEEQREVQEIERLQQETVSNYLGQLSEIFLNIDGDLRSDENQRIRTLATVSTLTFLRDPNLDGQSKGQVIKFLSQMELIQGNVLGDTNADETLPIINLNGADLSGADLIDANLINASLSGANLSGANLSHANLSSASLSGADLSSADLSNAFFLDANLNGANLSSADLIDANLIDASLRGIDLIDANLSGAFLVDAILSDTSLRNANLIDASFRNADLSSADLSGVDLSSANLSNANLSNADLSNANLRYASLSGANFTAIMWSETTQWPTPEEVAKARNISERLKLQVGIE